MINKDQIFCSFCGKSQDEVKKIIAGSDVFICNECVELSMDILRDEFKDDLSTDMLDSKTPKELLAILNDYVIGQDTAKRALSVAVYNHYKRINFVASKADDDIELQKPSGQTKIEEARAAASLFVQLVRAGTGNRVGLVSFSTTASSPRSEERRVGKSVDLGGRR